jgi:ABC-type multidrug transport system ATPase subunit
MHLQIGKKFSKFNFTSSYWQTQLFLARSRSIDFVTLVPRFDDPSRLAVGPVVNTIDALLGDVRDLDVSENGQFLFVSISRHRFELDSITRYYQVCQRLLHDPDNIFLKSFKPYCQALPPAHNVDLNQFVLTVSSCIDTVHCPSVQKSIIKTTDFPDGYFLMRPNALIGCLEGSYCHSGIRFDCSPGFSCPTSKLAAPLPCPQNSSTTCYNKGLTKPAACPPGATCTTQYLPPIMTPEGYYLKKLLYKDVTYPVGVEKCKFGDYCPFGREAYMNTTSNNTMLELLCPAKTYCVNATVLEPVICNISVTAMEYCPPGTTDPQLCPAGYYCTNLDIKVPCRLSQYCPPGSFASQVCPAGYYCPNPSSRIICPKDNYCPQGSTEPKPCNFFFSDCQSGSTSDHLTYVGIALLIAIILAVTSLWLLYMVAYRIYRHQSNMRRKGIKTNVFSSVKMDDEEFDANFLVDQSMNSDFHMNYGTVVNDNNLHRQDQFTVDLRFEELGLVLRSNGNKVLKGVTGEIKHGQLTAVMGMSGAGKSTFITTLAGRAYYGNRVGKIYINGKEESLKKFNKRVGFVPQEEIMLRMMTVEETLYFAARTRLDYRKSRREVQSIVDNVIRALRLEDVRHSVIGDEESRGISGGQRKRVNVAIELVADPYVLFLDEPTSGLDSASSKEVCQALQLIAQSGITVITVIHQPRKEIFDMFSHLLLLGQGGRTVYLGPVPEAVSYFEALGFKCPDRVNHADFLIDVTAGNITSERRIETQELPELWMQHENRLPVEPILQENENTGAVFVEPSLSYGMSYLCYIYINI